MNAALIGDEGIGDLRPLLAKVAAGHKLSESEAEAAFEIIMTGTPPRRRWGRS